MLVVRPGRNRRHPLRLPPGAAPPDAVPPTAVAAAAGLPDAGLPDARLSAAAAAPVASPGCGLRRQNLIRTIPTAAHRAARPSIWVPTIWRLSGPESEAWYPAALAVGRVGPGAGGIDGSCALMLPFPLVGEPPLISGRNFRSGPAVKASGLLAPAAIAAADGAPAPLPRVTPLLEYAGAEPEGAPPLPVWVG